MTRYIGLLLVIQCAYMASQRQSFDFSANQRTPANPDLGNSMPSARVTGMRKPEERIAHQEFLSFEGGDYRQGLLTGADSDEMWPALSCTRQPKFLIGG